MASGPQQSFDGSRQNEIIGLFAWLGLVLWLPINALILLGLTSLHPFRNSRSVIPYKQCVVIMGCKCTGPPPPCSVSCLTAWPPSGRPAGSVTDDRRQQAKQYWPNRRASSNHLGSILKQHSTLYKTIQCLFVTTAHRRSTLY